MLGCVRLSPGVVSSEKQAELFVLKRAALRIMPSDPVDAHALGSRLGGAPLATAGRPWPASEDGPLDLLVQLDLAEVARVWPDSPLPHHGLLSFFYDTDDQPWTSVSPNLDKWRVRWDHGKVLPLSPPEDWTTFPSRRIRFEAAMTMPRATEDDCVFQDLGLNAELSAVDDALGGGGPALHQLLGWPHLLQGSMTTTCQRESSFVRDSLDRFAPGKALSREDWDELDAGTRAADWRLLLQLGSDADSYWSWAGGGLYFWIRAEDLEAARFDHVWTVMQC
ncbi:YwqG family protein [Yinghuangia aomiensis]